MTARLPTVEELTAMILEVRREPGIWRAEVQAKWLAERIARHMAVEKTPCCRGLAPISECDCARFSDEAEGPTA